MPIGQMTQIYPSNGGWSDIYNPNPPLMTPNLDPGNYTAAFIYEAMFQARGARGAVIEFAMGNVAGARFLHWYLAFNVLGTPTTVATIVPEVLERVDNNVYLNEVQAGLTRFRRVDLSGANAVVRVAINFPAWINQVDNVYIATRRENGWGGAFPDVATISVALSDEPLAIDDIHAVYASQKGTTPGGMPITGTVINANHNALDVNVAGAGGLTVDVGADPQSLPAPNPAAILDTTTPVSLQVEPDHALVARARVTSDEGMFGDDFGNVTYPGQPSLFRPGAGTLTLTAASLAWSRSVATTPLREGDYVEITAQHSDVIPVMVQIDTIAAGGLSGTLVTAWGGASATGAWQISNYWYQQTGVGGTPIGSAACVADSCIAFCPGSDAGAVNQILRGLTYGGRKGTTPLYCAINLKSISARLVNQATIIGFCDPLGPAINPPLAAFEFSGGTAANVALRTKSEGGVNDRLTVTYPLPAGLDTLSPLLLEVWLRGDRVSWAINGSPYPDFTIHFPYPYQPMALCVSIGNAAAVADGTQVLVNEIVDRNVNEVDGRVTQPDATKLNAGVQFIGVNTAAETSVAAANADTALIAANAARKALVIRNDSDRVMYLGFGAAASSSSVYTIPAGGVWEDLATDFKGAVRGWWAAGVTGNARIQERV